MLAGGDSRSGEVEIRPTEALDAITSPVPVSGRSTAFEAPAAPAGAIILQTFSMEDGRIGEASVLRVSFG